MGQEAVWPWLHGAGEGREFKHVDTCHVAPLGLRMKYETLDSFFTGIDVKPVTSGEGLGCGTDYNGDV